MATKTTGNLLPGGVNTPLDARFAFDTLADAEQMQNPVLGGIFYCRADGKHYKITELESKLVGAITVANANSLTAAFLFCNTFKAIAKAYVAIPIDKTIAPERESAKTIYSKCNNIPKAETILIQSFL